MDNGYTTATVVSADGGLLILMTEENHDHPRW